VSNFDCCVLLNYSAQKAVRCIYYYTRVTQINSSLHSGGIFGSVIYQESWSCESPLHVFLGKENDAPSSETSKFAAIQTICCDFLTELIFGEQQFIISIPYVGLVMPDFSCVTRYFCSRYFIMLSMDR
jgi:hypothetical protein